MAFSCSDCREELSSFVDGELEPHTQSIVAGHITDCSNCRAEHDRYRSIGRLMQGSVVVKETLDIWSGLQNRLPSVCDCIQEDLSAYLDGELIAPVKEGVAAHLDECAVCLGKFKELSSVNSLLSKGLVLPASVEVDIWSQVKNRLNEDCVLIRSELSAFIDREVVTLRHREITAHLIDCSECKNEFLGLSAAGESLRAYYQPQLPDNFDLLPGIMDKMKVVPLEARPKARHAMPSRRLYAVAASLIIGVLASIGIFTSFHSTSPQLQPVTAEAYLIDSSLGEPGDDAETVVYGN